MSVGMTLWSSRWDHTAGYMAVLPTRATAKATFPTNTTSVLLLDASSLSSREKVLTGASGSLLD